MPRTSSLTEKIIGPDGLTTPDFLHWLQDQPNAILLETTRPDRKNTRTYIFLDPIETITAYSLENVQSCLSSIELALKAGHYVAGYLAYEAGYAFEEVLRMPGEFPFPLLRFGIYDKAWVYNQSARRFEEGEEDTGPIARIICKIAAVSNPSLFHLKPSLDRERYAASVEQIRRFISEGETYQVNFTFRMDFDWCGEVAELYRRLRFAQRVGYSALLVEPERAVVSFSPELFFRLDRTRLTLKPMKGTAPRGRTLEEDREWQRWLKNSAKDRAENLMIVDMLRNDAGRIATTGTVDVSAFFDIEQYETVYQATSTIDAKIRSDATIVDIFRSLFPCGSVTGAPKIRTMQIIRQLEREPRGIYTGAIGFWSPKKKAVFSVAIRTLVLERNKKKGEMGVGSGVVHDSSADAEYEECLVKSRFLTELAPDFQLIETMRWTPGRGFVFLRLHMRRLQRSARYFGFTLNARRVQAELRRLHSHLKKQQRAPATRVRLTVNRTGEVTISHTPLVEAMDGQKVILSRFRTNSGDRFLYHKTTHRRLYEEELERARSAGYFDVLFLNERGELTEGARSNIILRINGTFVTPPVACGLLPGVFRQYLLTSRTHSLTERALTLHDLSSADAVFVCNAVHGLIPVDVMGR